MSALIELRGISKRFRMGERDIDVLRDVDLDIGSGEFVAVMGASGSGKTTLLEILGALSRPNEGSYRFDGEAIEARSDDGLADLRARRIGFVFQTFHLMPRMSAVRNAALPLLYAGVRRADREARARRLLERLGLAHRLDHRPAQLSGGERQRVAIARALILEPKILLLDEPTSALDVSVQAEVLNLLVRLKEEFRLTYLFVSHDLGVIAHMCERFAVMQEGRIVEEAEVGDLRRGALSHPFTRELRQAYGGYRRRG